MVEHADTIHAASYPLDFLRANLFGVKKELSRTIAVLLLGQKDYPRKVGDLRRVLLDESESSRVREAAAQALARTPAPSAGRALREGLQVKDPVTLRAVVTGLALRGDRTALPAVAGLAAGNGVAGEAAAWAARLLRYRTGESGEGVPPPAVVLRPDPKDATAITVRAADPASVERASAAVAASLQGFASDVASAVSLTCGERKLMILLDREIVQAGLAARLRGSKALVAVVAEHSTEEGDAWEVAYLILTEPRLDREQAQVAVVTPRGRLVFDGVANVRDEDIDFELAGVEGPGGVPVDLAGSIARGRIRFKKALVSSVRTKPDAPVPIPRRG